MDDLPIISYRGEDAIFRQFLAQYDAPAYVRRALRVEEHYERLIARCRRQREDWLTNVRTQLGLLRARAGEWIALLPWLEDESQLDVLQELWELLQPKLRIRVEPTSRARSLRRDLRLLLESIDRFNRRWTKYLNELDLSAVNAGRDGYNRYYLLEKECALRSARLARAGFQRLESLTPAELLIQVPSLPVPRLQS